MLQSWSVLNSIIVDLARKIFELGDCDSVFFLNVSVYSYYMKRGFKIKYWSLTALVSSELTGCPLVGCLHYFCSGPFAHFCPIDHAGILSTSGWKPNIEPWHLWRTSDSIDSCGPRSSQHLGYRSIPHFKISWTRCARTSQDCCWQGCCWSTCCGLRCFNNAVRRHPRSCGRTCSYNR